MKNSKILQRVHRVVEGVDYNEVVICDCCGKSCSPKDLSDEYCKKNNINPQEFITMKGYWGYFSTNKDLMIHECCLCEPCYEKVATFIVSLGGKIRRYEYDAWDGEPIQQLPSIGESPTATSDCSDS